MPTLISPLCQFAAFAYDGMICFIGHYITYICNSFEYYHVFTLDHHYYYYYYYYSFGSFSHQYLLVVFHWSLSDSKSPHVSRTFLNILADLNCCCSAGLHSSSHFQVLQSLYQFFGDCTKYADYNWCHRHFLSLLYSSS